MDANKIWLIFKLFKSNSTETEMLSYKWKNLGDAGPHTEILVKLIARAEKKY